jgi:hypothetical protein
MFSETMDQLANLSKSINAAHAALANLSSLKFWIPLETKPTPLKEAAAKLLFGAKSFAVSANHAAELNSRSLMLLELKSVQSSTFMLVASKNSAPELITSVLSSQETPLLITESSSLMLPCSLITLSSKLEEEERKG